MTASSPSTRRRTLATGPGLDGVAGWLRPSLGPATGCWLPPAGPGGITLDTDPDLRAEAYRLEVDPTGVSDPRR